MRLCIWPMWANGWWLRAAPNWLASHFASHTAVKIKGVPHSRQKKSCKHVQTCPLSSFHKTNLRTPLSHFFSSIFSRHLWVHESKYAQLRSKLPTCSERQGRLEHLEHLGRSVRLVLEIRKSCYQNYPMRPCSPTPGKLAFYIKKCYKKQYVKSTTLGTGAGGLNASIICILFPCLSAHCPTLLRSLPSNLDGVEA